MGLALTLHPDSRCAAVARIDVDIARPTRDDLVLRYVVTGTIGDLRLPPADAPLRADRLWEHTCFEAFVRAPPDAAYYEFNVAPSMQWAAYRFDDHRKGMRVAREVGAPRIEVQSAAETYELRATLTTGRLPLLPVDADWRLGLSAVIEEVGGGKSYWALAHPPGRADFHHADCFALELPAA